MREGGASTEVRGRRDVARRNFRNAVRKAKSTFFAKNIEGISDTRGIFRAATWAHKQVRLRAPPLKSPGGAMLSEAEDKCTLLLDTHTAGPRGGDAEPPVFMVDRPARTWTSFSEIEVKRSIWKPANTAPGVDGIRNDAWKKAWPQLKGAIVRLYNASLEAGVYPKIFKTSSLCAVPKPGRDRKEPRSYRLISLLPTLGKGLERLVARRLAFEAVEKGIMPKAYACATPKRAATDLTLD
jgi:hypothetical protein